MKIRVLALMAAFLLPSPALAQSKTAGAIIDSVMEAYGGRRTLLGVHAYRFEGVLRAHVRKKNAEIIRIVRKPLYMEFMIRYPSKMEMRRNDARGTWRGRSPHTLTRVQGPMGGSVVLQAARANLPWLLEDRRSQAKFSRSAHGFDVLEIPLEDGLLLIVFVESRTGRIVRSEGVVKVGKREIRFQTRYSDFRMVEGVLFPFREETYISNMHTGTTTAKKIQVNPPDEKMKLSIPPDTQAR